MHWYVKSECERFGIPPTELEKFLVTNTTTYEIYYRDAKHEYFVADLEVTEELANEWKMPFSDVFGNLSFGDFRKIADKVAYAAYNAKYEAFKDKIDELPELPDLTEEELEDTEIADYPCYILHYDGDDYAFYDKIRGLTKV